MQATTTPKKALNPSAPMDRALCVIDLGNGQVKALIKAPGSDFKRISFPSFVASPSIASSDCIQFEECDRIQTYLVGERAAVMPGSNTGASEHGKSINAKALLIHALRLAFGDECKSIHCDVIFTSPSNKVYGSDISQRLTGVTPVTVPADSEVIGSQPKQFTVVVHRAIPQLEGHYAFTQLKLKRDSWVIDCGNRTMIATLVSPTGRILRRQYFGDAGVQALTQSITRSESLSHLLAEPTPQKVMDVLFSGKDVVSAIAADVDAVTAEVALFIGIDDAPRFLIGGGARVPGLDTALNAKVAKNAQWLNIESLAAVSAQILEG